MPNHQEYSTNLNLTNRAKDEFKNLGYQVLDKIYEQNTMPASVVQSFRGVHNEFCEKFYLDTFCHEPDVLPSFASIIKGVNRYFRGNPAHVKERQDYLMQVVSIMWALKDKAAQQGDHYERGSIKINDPDGKLFDFLKGYVQFATGHDNPGYLKNANDFAYSRHPQNGLSSHYKNFETEQYGIDIRFKGAAPTLDILPCKGDSHLLFGRVKINQTWYTFVKAEPIGLGHFLEGVEHAKNLVIPQKHDGINRKEKEMPRALKEAYEKFRLAQRIDKKVKTVSDMYLTVMRTHDLTEKGNEAKVAFLHAVEVLNFSKDIMFRTGNEVILDFQIDPHNINQILPEEDIDMMNEFDKNDKPKTLSQKIAFPVTFYTATLLPEMLFGYEHWNHITDKLILGALPIATETNGMGNHRDKIMEACIAKGSELGGVFSIVNEFEIKGENLGLIPVSPEDWKEKNVHHALVPMDDFGGKIDISVVKKQVDEMHKIIESGKSVYVHCKAGKGRSFSFIVAYLLMHSDMDVTQIFGHIREKRPQVSPGSAQLILIERFRSTYCPHKAPLDKNSVHFQSYRKDWKSKVNRLTTGFVNAVSAFNPFGSTHASETKPAVVNSVPNAVQAIAVVEESAPTLILSKRKTSSVESSAKRQKLTVDADDDNQVAVTDFEGIEDRSEQNDDSRKRLKR